MPPATVATRREKSTRSEIRRVHERVEQRVDAHEEHRLVGLELLDEAGEIARIDDQQPGAAQRGEQQAVRGQRKDMIERQCADVGHALELDLLEPRARLQHVGHHIAVREHGSLGDSGRAAGVLQEGQILVVEPRGQELEGAALLEHRAQPMCARDLPARHLLLHVTQQRIHDRTLGPAQQITDARDDHMAHVGRGQRLRERRGKILQHQHGGCA